MGFKDFDKALAFRDIVATIAEKVVERMRPSDKIGQVQDYNRFVHVANVLLPGDPNPIQARFPRHLQPTRRLVDPVDEGNPVGDTVRVSGTPGNYWITEILYGQVYMGKPILERPIINGGIFGDENLVSYFGETTPLPPVGQCVYMGRFDNSHNFLSSDRGMGYAVLRVAHTVFTSEEKVYRFTLSSIGNSSWFTLLPELDSGPSNGNDFQTEIRLPGSGRLELRVRRLSQGGSWEPGGYKWALELWGQGWTQLYLPDADEGIESLPNIMDEPRPAQVFGTNNGGHDDDVSTRRMGPFFDSPRHTIEVRSQFQVTGGTDAVIDGSTSVATLKWGEVFHVHTGRTWYTSDIGVIRIPMPAQGTFIEVHGSASGFTSTTVGAGGFSLAFGGVAYSSLYYEPTYDGNQSTGSWHLVCYDQRFQIPSHWIFVAAWDNRNGGSITLCNGITDTGWRDAHLTPGYVQWRRVNNQVEVKVFQSGVSLPQGTTILGTIPSYVRPNQTRRDFATFNGFVSTGAIEVSASGDVSVNHQLSTNRTSVVGSVTYLLN